MREAQRGENFGRRAVRTVRRAAPAGNLSLTRENLERDRFLWGEGWCSQPRESKRVAGGGKAPWDEDRLWVRASEGGMGSAFGVREEDCAGESRLRESEKCAGDEGAWWGELERILRTGREKERRSDNERGEGWLEGKGKGKGGKRGREGGREGGKGRRKR